MNWMNFFIVVGVCYAAYYLTLVLFDLYQAKSVSRKVAANQSVSYEIIETKGVGSYAEKPEEPGKIISTDQEKKKKISTEGLIPETEGFIKQDLGLISTEIEETGYEINERNLSGFMRANNRFNLLYV